MRRIRSAGHWLILAGILGAACAAAVEGRVGRHAVAGLVVVATGIAIAGSASLVFLRRGDGRPALARAARVGVPVALAVVGGTVTVVVAEARVGAVTRTTVAVLLTAALVTVSGALLYATDHDGIARFSKSRRVGIPVATGLVAGLAASVVVEGGWGAPTMLGLALGLSMAAVRVMLPALRDEAGRRWWWVPPEVRLGAALGVLVIAAVGTALLLDGRAAAVLGLACTALALAVLWRVAIPLLYAVDRRGRWRVSHVTRARVLGWTGVVTSLWVLVLVEGRLGAASLVALGALALLPLARVLVPALYGLNRRGLPRVALPLRVGVGIVVVFAVGLGALGATIDGGSSDLSAATIDEAGVVAASTLGNHVFEPTGAPAELQPRFAARGAVQGAVLGRWDTVGDRFADQVCADGGPLDGGAHATMLRAPLDGFAQVAVDAQLDAAQAALAAVPTAAQAEAAGYQAATAPLGCVGAYYAIGGALAFDDAGDRFDPARPTILRYAGTHPEAPLVGVSYVVRRDEAPAGFAGANDHWHRYEWLCLTGATITGVGVAPDACAGEDQRWHPGHDLWVLHAWVVPGWENPLGVFAAGHAGLG